MCGTVVRHSITSLENHFNVSTAHLGVTLMDYFKENILGRRPGEEIDECPYPCNTDYPCLFGDCVKMYETVEDLKFHIEDLHCTLTNYLERFE